MSEEKPNLKEEQPEKEMTEDERKNTFMKNLLSALSKFDSAPTQEQIEGWKKEYHDVLASAFDDNEVFIFRPLSRKEHLQLKNDIATQQEQSAKNPDILVPTEDDFQQSAVDVCILWTSDKDSLQYKAGSYSILFEQIMLHSNFMSPSMAAQLVIKL